MRKETICNRLSSYLPLLKFIKTSKLLLAFALTLALAACVTPQRSHYRVVQTTPKPVTTVRKADPDSRLLHTRLPVHAYLKEKEFQPPSTFFGPLFTGSDLGEIELVLGSLPTVHTLYLNNFFSGHPNKTYYDRYFGSSGAPTSDPPALTINPVPGNFSNTDGLYRVVLSLSRIDFSSKYGGSVELLFYLKEDYEMELRKDNLLWDIRQMAVRIYVTLKPIHLNQAPLSTPGVSNLEVEFKPMQVTAYRLQPPPGIDFISVAPEGVADDLAGMLQVIATQIENDTNIHVKVLRLVLGRIYALHNDMFDPTTLDVVDVVKITDGALMLVTHVGQPYVKISFMLENIKINTEAGGEEIIVDGWSERFYTNGTYLYLTDYKTGKMDEGESTRWITADVFPLSSCESDVKIAKIQIEFYFIEDDDLLDDRSDFMAHEIELDCAEALVANTGNFPKLVEETESPRLAIEGVEGGDFTNSITEGAYTLRTRTYLILL
jgi:hypothetical protein